MMQTKLLHYHKFIKRSIASKLLEVQSPITNFARVLKQIAEKDGEVETATEEVVEATEEVAAE